VLFRGPARHVQPDLRDQLQGRGRVDASDPREVDVAPVGVAPWRDGHVVVRGADINPRGVQIDLVQFRGQRHRATPVVSVGMDSRHDRLLGHRNCRGHAGRGETQFAFFQTGSRPTRGRSPMTSSSLSETTLFNGPVAPMNGRPSRPDTSAQTLTDPRRSHQCYFRTSGRAAASHRYSRTRATRPMRPLTLSLSPSGGEGIETTPSPSARERGGVRVAPMFTHDPG